MNLLEVGMSWKKLLFIMEQTPFNWWSEGKFTNITFCANDLERFFGIPAGVAKNGPALLKEVVNNNGEILQFVISSCHTI